MRAFLCGVLLALALLFFAGASISAEEPEAEEKSCVLDASLKYDVDKFVNDTIALAEGRGISFTEEEKRNFWEELYKTTRESLEPYYSIVKTAAECTTYFPSRELEDILREEPQRLCIRIGTIEEEVEKSLGEMEKEEGFSFPEAERRNLKGRIVQRYVREFLKKGIFLADSECPKKE